MSGWKFWKVKKSHLYQVALRKYRNCLCILHPYLFNTHFVNMGGFWKSKLCTYEVCTNASSLLLIWWYIRLIVTKMLVHFISEQNSFILSYPSTLANSLIEPFLFCKTLLILHVSSSCREGQIRYFGRIWNRLIFPLFLLWLVDSTNEIESESRKNMSLMLLQCCQLLYLMLTSAG